MSNLISLCMIVLNEEECLPRALENWRDLADELIVVVDSRTTDNTVAIAKANGAQVLYYTWHSPGHKGEARNAAIDAATGKWIVMLDADETVEKPVELRAWLIDSSVHGVFVQKANVEPSGAVSLIYNQQVIFQRAFYRYKYREHETVSAIADNVSETVTDFFFIHRPPTERKAAKVQPMLQRLILDVEENPGDVHPLYFLHRQYMHLEQWDKAIAAGQQFLRLAGPDNDKCEAYGNMATCHEKRGEFYEALRYLHFALADQPTRKVWWVRIAELYKAHSQPNIALGYLRAATEFWPQPEQHYQPGLGMHVYQLITECQLAIAHGGHSH